MKVLVTGGAGFIGHHLVAALLRRGDDVRVLDDLSSGDRRRLDGMLDDIELLEGSILDRTILSAAVQGRDVVLHQAAVASVPRSLEAPAEVNEVNVAGTIAIIMAAAAQGVRRVVFAGSSAVYGEPTELPCRESFRPSPESPYGVGKLAAELYLHTLGRHLGVESVSLRYFNVFGPGQDPRSQYAAVVPRFVTAVLDRRRPTVHGDGEVTRDFVYVDNVVSANLLAAEASAPTGLTANIAAGTSSSLNDLLAAIGRATELPVDPVYGPPRPGDITHSFADITLAREHLGYRVLVPFEEGIKRTVDWYRQQGARAR